MALFLDSSFELPKLMLKLMVKKINNFTLVKFASLGIRRLKTFEACLFDGDI